MRYLAYIFMLIVLAGCSSQKLFSIDPAEEGIDYQEGNKIAVFEDSLFASTINFEHQYGDQLVFFTYFENNSDSAVIVDPGEFYYQLYKNSNDIDTNRLLIKRTAFDPELQIDAMNTGMRDAENEKAALTFLNCLVGTASVVAAVATDDEDDECDESFSVVDAIGSTIENQTAIEESYDYEMADLFAQREFWKNEVLRKTTLYPGERIGGLVHFPLHEEAGWLKINLILGPEIHSFKFKQSLIP